MQHGRAMTENDDPRRPLSVEGAAAVTKMSAWARDAGIHVQQIRHSDKLRAQQTAQIVADHIKITGGVNRVSGLGPNDDINAIGRSIQTQVANLMLVGHLPFLSRLVVFSQMRKNPRGNLRACRDEDIHSGRRAFGRQIGRGVDRWA